MKECRDCKIVKSYSDFNKNKAKRDGYGDKCRPCMKIYRQNHYNSNKLEIVNKVTARRAELFNYIWQIKCNSRCVDCGNADPRVLDFDHLGDKEFNLSEVTRRGFGRSKIDVEIAKCEIRCANCHRIKTFERKIDNCQK